MLMDSSYMEKEKNAFKQEMLSKNSVQELLNIEKQHTRDLLDLMYDKNFDQLIETVIFKINPYIKCCQIPLENKDKKVFNQATILKPSILPTNELVIAHYFLMREKNFFYSLYEWNKKFSLRELVKKIPGNTPDLISVKNNFYSFMIKLASNQIFIMA